MGNVPDSELVAFFEPLSKAGFRVEECIALFCQMPYEADPPRLRAQALRLIGHRDRIVKVLGDRLLEEASR